MDSGSSGMVYSATVFILVSYLVSEADSKTCVYHKSQYNVITGGYDKIQTSEHCLWGCCDEDNKSPCCTVPINLIVGVTLGGMLLTGLTTAAFCCFCVCRRRHLEEVDMTSVCEESRRTSNASSHVEDVPYRPAFIGGTVTFAPPTYIDSPPSYEDVMKGEINIAFKPDTGGASGHSGS